MTQHTCFKGTIDQIYIAKINMMLRTDYREKFYEGYYHVPYVPIYYPGLFEGGDLPIVATEGSWDPMTYSNI